MMVCFFFHNESHYLCVCVCVRERERERERNHNHCCEAHKGRVLTYVGVLEKLCVHEFVVETEYYQ